MDRRTFDNNFVVAILAGGTGIMLYELFELWFRLHTNTILVDDFYKEFYPKAFAGIIVLLFALFYAILTRGKQINNKVHSEKKRSWWDWFWNGGERY